jgi:hypothetical protein
VVRRDVQLAGQLGERERVVEALEQQILGRLGELGVLMAGGGAAGGCRRRPADRACDELCGRLLDEQRVVEAAREAAGEQEAVGVGSAEGCVRDVELARRDEQADVAAGVAQRALIGLERAVEDDVVGGRGDVDAVADQPDGRPGKTTCGRSPMLSLVSCQSASPGGQR